MAIHELIVITDDIRNMMMNHARTSEIKDHLREKGVRFLIDDGLEKVKQGRTTIEEILKVANLND